MRIRMRTLARARSATLWLLILPLSAGFPSALLSGCSGGGNGIKIAEQPYTGPEIALDSSGTTDDDMIGAGNSMFWQRFAGEGAKAALHPVADDRIADLLGDGEADAHRHNDIAARADEQDKAGHGGALAAVGGEEIRALGERD